MAPTDAAILNLADLMVPGMMDYASEGDHDIADWCQRARAATQPHMPEQRERHSGPKAP